MPRLISEQLHDFLSRIPANIYDEALVKQVLASEISNLAPVLGIRYLAIHSVIPQRNFKEKPKITDDVVFQEGTFLGIDMHEQKIEHGDGGYTIFEYQYAFDCDIEETEKNLSDFFYIVFMLVGRTRSMQYMIHSLYHDRMTGLYNDTGMYHFAGDIYNKGKFAEYNSYFINIKEMQMVNDQYGSAAGDAVIKAYAAKLAQYVDVRSAVGRLGGDNFFVFLRRENHDSFLENIREMSISITLTGGKEINLKMGCKAGYAQMTSDTPLENVLAYAAVAKNMAGKNGNDEILEYSDKLMSIFRQRKLLQASIPAALEKHEFEVYYQPKAHLSEDGTLVLFGAEALVRWNKDGRIIMPGEFIPVLEEMGLIGEIDFYVFDRVCCNIMKWIDMGYKPIIVSSNFSQRHLSDEHFADKLFGIINKYGVPPELLEVEITESFDIHNLEKMASFAELIHSSGISLSVDDFGSGYASFGMIKNISADIIKLDKCLVDGIDTGNPQDEIIVSSVISMVDRLGKKLIAEGVETKKQLDFLIECGCEYIQGYLYGKPLPEQEFLEQYMKFLKNYKTVEI